MTLDNAGRPIKYRYVPAPVFLGAGRGAVAPVPGRFMCGVCAFTCGIPMVAVLVIMLFLAPWPSPTMYLLALLGFLGSLVATVVGILLFLQSNKESTKVVKAITDRDGITLDTISMETGVPYSRVRTHVLRGIATKILKGRIVDEMYVSRVLAERNDSDTIRCPHCG
ncbi:MAG: hypothetical protein ACW992_11615, partial [Candidatus Thorarchaeota archaeon]